MNLNLIPDCGEIFKLEKFSGSSKCVMNLDKKTNLSLSIQGKLVLMHQLNGYNIVASECNN